MIHRVALARGLAAALVAASVTAPSGAAPATRGRRADRPQVAQAPQPPTGKPDPVVFTWTEAVERHEAGQLDAAARSVAGWSERDLGRVLEQFDAASRKATPGSAEAQATIRLVNRGVLLHTDIALAAQGTAGVSNLLQTVDGERAGVGSTLHLEFAARLVTLNPDRRASRDDTVRAWYRAVSSHLLHGRRFGEMAVLLARWRATLLGSKNPDPREFPEDESFMFAYGCFHEGLTAPAACGAMRGACTPPIAAAAEGGYSGLESGPSPGSRPWRFDVRTMYYRANLEQAFLAYRGVVEINPKAAEARVRLGRVECARGNCGSGVRNLRAGADLPGADPVVKYYAAMFLGQAQESRGKYEEARQEYERAAALFPSAQSPLLALGALADRSADRGAASRHAARLWSRPAGGERAYDPWWDYDGGPRDGEALLLQLYRAIDGGRDARQ